MITSLRLLIEFLLLFVALPLIFYFDLVSFPKIPALILVSLFCAIIIMLDSSFRKAITVRASISKPLLRKILLRFTFFAGVLTIFTIYLDPSQLFIFPRTRPSVWIMVMLLYPIFSALPQEFMYRTYFYHRYKTLFPRPTLLFLMSVFSFSFIHIIFDNWIAVLFTLFGGYIFTKTYEETDSLLITSLEHALYGAFIFTIGLGQFFFEG